MRLFTLLLVVTVVTHFGYDPICALVPSLAHASKGLFYVFRGVEGAVLFGVVCYLRPALWPICLLGMAEEGETAVCRTMAGPLSIPPPAAPWSGLCGDLAAVPFYMIGVVYIAILVTHGREK